MKKKSIKIVLLVIVAIIMVAFLGVEKVLYIFSGDSERIAYRAAEVIFSENDNEISVNNENQNLTNDQYVFEDSGDLKVYYFDVGQADCIFITNNNENMLIDAGNNADGKLLVEQLKDMNITKIDYLVGTHAHEDHIGGLDDVLENFEVENVLMPRKSTTTKTYEDVLTAVQESNLKITASQIGDVFYLGGAICEIMNVDHDSDDLNETSIVIELTYGYKKFLFTGDTETTKENERNWNDIDVLKVAHHGSSTSTSEEFLEQAKPEYAVISCGINNDYGHPHKEVVSRLKGIETYRTDKDGTVLITCDGENIEIEKLEIDLNGNEE